MHHHMGYLLPVGLSLALVVFVNDTLSRRGIYASLDPGTPDWQRTAFDHWWANGRKGASAQFVQCAFLFWTFYYVLRHNVVGLIAHSRLRRLFPLRATESTLDFTVPAADLERARQIMALMIYQVAISTLLLAFPFFMLVLAAPSGIQDFVAFFALIILVLSPSYIVIPTMRFNRHVSLAYQEMDREIAAREASARKSGQSRDLALVTLDRLHLADAPRSLLSTVQVLGFGVVYLIPVITFFDWGLQRLL